MGFDCSNEDFPPETTPKQKMISLMFSRLVKQNDRRVNNLHLTATHFMRHKKKMKKIGYPKMDDEESSGQGPQKHQMQCTDENEGVEAIIRKTD